MGNGALILDRPSRPSRHHYSGARTPNVVCSGVRAPFASLEPAAHAATATFHVASSSSSRLRSFLPRELIVVVSFRFDFAAGSGRSAQRRSRSLALAFKRSRKCERGSERRRKAEFPSGRAVLVTRTASRARSMTNGFNCRRSGLFDVIARDRVADSTSVSVFTPPRRGCASLAQSRPTVRSPHPVENLCVRGRSPSRA